MEKKRDPQGANDYPESASAYELTNKIGSGAFATVYAAKVLEGSQKGSFVAIKILDLDELETSWDVIEKETNLMRLLDHPNVIQSYCSFIDEVELWLVMPLMNGGSCAAIMRSRFKEGFGDEALIATILREILQGLQYLHDDNRIHRDVKAGNVLLSRDGEVRLADYGVAGCLMDAGQKKGATRTFTGTPAWMAPEVMEQTAGHDYKADIWSLGITSLELCYGRPPYANHAPMKILMLTLQSEPPSTDIYGDQAVKTSKVFKGFVSSCLKKDVSKRPSAKELLKHKFLKKARGAEYIRSVLFASDKDSRISKFGPESTPDKKSAQQASSAPKPSRQPISVEAFDFGDDDNSVPEPTNGVASSRGSRESGKHGRFTVEIEE
uniref:Protein kinase superfamily protein n=1 Tax=Hirondellea gigas TaxID=1518452 RepID=A0A6A7G119_9CRUS